MSDKSKETWEKILREMISGYRLKNPLDGRDDYELLDSLMKHFVSNGVIEMKDGKYQLPQINDPDTLIKMLKASLQ